MKNKPFSILRFFETQNSGMEEESKNARKKTRKIRWKRKGRVTPKAASRAKEQWTKHFMPKILKFKMKFPVSWCLPVRRLCMGDVVVFVATVYSWFIKTRESNVVCTHFYRAENSKLLDVSQPFAEILRCQWRLLLLCANFSLAVVVVVENARSTATTIVQ